MTLGEIIKNYRESFGLSMDAFAERSGLSKGYISILEKDTHPTSGKHIAPSITVVQQAALGMNMDPAELFRMVSGAPSGSKIPVYGRVAAGIPLEMITDINYIDFAQNGQENEYMGLIIRGDSMAPDIHDGDTVIVHRQDDAESGDIIIATVNGDEATCKRLRKYRDGIELVSINPSFQPFEYSNEEIENLPVTILGKVVEVRRKI